MIRYTLRRLALLPPTLLVVATIAFLVTYALPGDPAAVMLGPEASPDEVARLRAELGSDEPLLRRYLGWLWGVVRLDLGDSLFLGRPVVTAIAERLGATLQLALYAIVLAAVLGVSAGVVAASRPRSVLDRGITFLATSGTAVAGFFLGMVLILVFAVQLRWLPAGGYVELTTDPFGHLRSMALPTLALALPLAGLPARLTRAGILESAGSDHVRTARGKGLRTRAVLLRHQLPGTLVPTVTVLGTATADLLGGAVVIETVFNLPGMGQLVATSIAQRDLVLLHGAILTAALVHVLVSLAIDLTYTALDPRLTHVDP